MSLDPEFLEILRCPNCKSKVELTDDKSGLRCVNEECRLIYPIRENIPVMLVDETTKAGETSEQSVAKNV